MRRLGLRLGLRLGRGCVLTVLGFRIGPMIRYDRGGMPVVISHSDPTLIATAEMD